MESLWWALVWFLPAGVANAAPIIAAQLPGLSRFSTPLDFNRTWRGKPLFGRTKTWRGLVAAGLAGGASAWLLSFTPWWTLEVPAFWFGLSIGLGAIFGDALESFCKRRLGKESGERFMPWDQVDYIIGGILASLFFVIQPWWLYLLTGALYVILHRLLSIFGFRLGIKNEPW